MDPPPPEDLTRLLRRVQDGDPGALDRLAPRVYAELHRMAHGFLRREDARHTLQPTALVNEAWLKLASQESLGFEHRAQFFSAAATIMRRILIDHARARKTTKRGNGARPEPLDEAVEAFERSVGDLLDLEEALDALALEHPRKARLVELRFFLGLEMREAAEILAVSLRQVERDWTLARAWLRRRLGDNAS